MLSNDFKDFLYANPLINLENLKTIPLNLHNGYIFLFQNHFGITITFFSKAET